MAWFTNLTLLGFVSLLTLTGLFGLVWTTEAWVGAVHRVAAWGLIALIPWKAAGAWKSLRRGTGPGFDRSLGLLASLALAASALLVAGLGVLWKWRFGPQSMTILGWVDSLVSWHWMLGLASLPLLALHTWRHWPRPEARDPLGRRGFLQAVGLGAAGALGWWASDLWAAAREHPASARRFTGSREAAYFSGNDFPVTSMARDGKEPLDLEAWRLQVDGQVRRPLRFSYQELLNLSTSTETHILDCTVGWFSEQRWSGVPLAGLLRLAEPNGGPRSVRLVAAEGYAHRFSLRQAEAILLATHVGGETLEHRHGFPLRAVVPGRRGWFWMKWVTRIEVIG